MNFSLFTGLNKFLLTVLTVIIIANLVIIYLYFNDIVNHEVGKKLLNKFYVDYENNVPTYFNTLLFLILSFSAGMAYSLNKTLNSKKDYYWFFLSVLFFFLSVDENIQIHEFIGLTLPKYGIGGSGIFRYAWIIPYSIFLTIFGLFSIRFLLNLDKFTRYGFIISACIYLSGAFGFEILSSMFEEEIGTNNIQYALTVTIEEFLEMLGLIICIRFFIKYFQKTFESITIYFIK